MSAIPAGSIHGVDLDRIRGINANAATEIERIGQLLLKGEETEEEFLQLCELLYQVGEQARAEELLVASATEGDRLHALHRRLFGAVESDYDKAVRAFSEQMGVSLTRVRSPRLCSCVFACSVLSRSDELRHGLGDLLTRPCEAHITYEPGGLIVADVYSVSDLHGSVDMPSRSSSLHYENGTWIIDHG